MSLAAAAIDKRVVTYFAVLLLVLGGIASFFALGQLEDPEFTVKTAVITTPYPGASPEEVELEITDRIELAIQEMREVDIIESVSRPGQSQITVDIHDRFTRNDMPQIWDELRRKIRDIETALPPGAGRPIITDDFGDVFGLLLAMTSDGFTHAELENYANDVRRELSLVEGVARIDLWGVQERAVYLDVRESRLAQLGISLASIESTLAQQNAVVDGGGVDLTDRRMRIAPSGSFASPQDIEQLVIRPSPIDALLAGSADRPNLRNDELITIGDIAEVQIDYRQPPRTLMSHNGLPAVALAIANQPGINVVELGRAVEARLDGLIAGLPVGIEVHRVAWQPAVVEEAVNGFLISLAEALAIVLVVLTLAMGWRMGLVIGSGLLLTILATFMLMAAFGIDLQRMSLGALVIALGMMVDNSIVVAEGYVVRLKQGQDPRGAAIAAADRPAGPLLGATVIAVLAFYPVYAAESDAGEYCATLFTVVAISLLVSWVVSITVTPLQCIDLLPPPKDATPAEGESREATAGAGAEEGRFFALFRRFLTFGIRFRWLTIAATLLLLVSALGSFGHVRQLFFPASSMAMFMVDYWGPEGSRIEQVAADIEVIRQRLSEDERIDAVSNFAGAGPPRFYLPVSPESPSPAYGQLLVSVGDHRDIDDIVRELTPWLQEAFPEALVPIRKFGLGPSNTWTFEYRISGPADTDPAVLRDLADRGMAILEQSPLTAAVQTDWRQRASLLVPAFSDARARWVRINREDLATSTRRAFDGQRVGLYREDDDLIPILLRRPADERVQVGGLDALQLLSNFTTASVPMASVVDGIGFAWEDPLIVRRDRRRTITIQSNPILGVTLPEYRQSVLAEFEELGAGLPPGYTAEWGGEHENTVESQASLVPGIIPAVALMLFILVYLFNDLRRPLVIVLTLPFVLIGVIFGLLGTGAAFGFVALLGAMSLSGMMIKNAIVLLDEVEANLKLGMDRYRATVDAAVSRLRPVALAAATTVLGVIPLLQDVFWVGLAVAIMAGLSFGTLLTMILVPVLYATLYRVKSPPAERIATPAPAYA